MLLNALSWPHSASSRPALICGGSLVAGGNRWAAVRQRSACSADDARPGQRGPGAYLSTAIPRSGELEQRFPRSDHVVDSVTDQ